MVPLFLPPASAHGANSCLTSLILLQPPRSQSLLPSILCCYIFRANWTKKNYQARRRPRFRAPARYLAFLPGAIEQPHREDPRPATHCETGPAGRAVGRGKEHGGLGGRKAGRTRFDGTIIAAAARIPTQTNASTILVACATALSRGTHTHRCARLSRKTSLSLYARARFCCATA